MSYSSERVVSERVAANTPAKTRAALLLTAWVGTLLLSRFPQILLRESGLISPASWSLWWWILIGAALLALTYLWAGARSLRGYFMILTMIYGFTIGLSLLGQTSVWNSWFGPDRPWLASFFGERLAVVLMALGLAGTLALMGQKREDFYLTLGNVNAPVARMRLTWKIAGPLIALPLAGVIAAVILAMNPLAPGKLAAVFPLLPAVLLFALMNAFGEEMAYRAAPLAQLWQVVGKEQAIWMVAVWFGLGHYYGGISFGALGAVFFTLVAVLFGRAMIETKGLAVPVFMHLWGDVVLYIFLALGQS